ncbi:MAG: SigE family RNA polymerase sigma factor, partial [Actinobacteria bacterium]|nr:SigE family RNA polymerase sigma factor [Actinomycetota bacterium]NIS30938.1 SigE family RNA polymerase sigma factor [Actinomycetota bacterium]NIU67445.1 SigE family RNA polymerase sigma factor [Actinomycetota bacterium]NIW29219.1 SigE family RNA polymerase sigma factor [Actinomycetota bacterium]
MRELPVEQVLGQFDAFYRARYRSVVALVYALTGSRWVAEDMAQEAFLRVHRDWNRVKEMAAPEAWVRRVAVNLAMSRFRRLKAETTARLRLSTSAPELPHPAAEYDEFWREVRRLPARQSQAIV